MVNALQTIAIMVLKSLISIGLFNAQFIGTPTELVSLFLWGFAAGPNHFQADRARHGMGGKARTGRPLNDRGMASEPSPSLV